MIITVYSKSKKNVEKLKEQKKRVNYRLKNREILDYLDIGEPPVAVMPDISQYLYCIKPLEYRNLRMKRQKHGGRNFALGTIRYNFGR